MLVIVCRQCLHAIRVMGDPSEVGSILGEGSPFWPNGYICFSCGAAAEILLEPEIDAAVVATLNMYNLSPVEALAALHGLGMPHERNCYKEELDRIFAEYEIKLHGRQHREQARYYLDSIELKDGTRVFFAPSPHGACIYRIAKPHRYSENGNQ